MEEPASCANFRADRSSSPVSSRSPCCCAHRLAPVRFTDADLAVDVREVELDRLLGHPELLRDLAVGEALRDETEDLELPTRQDIRRLAGGPPRSPVAAAPAGGTEMDRIAEQDPDRAREVVRVGPLPDEAQRARGPSPSAWSPRRRFPRPRQASSPGGSRASGRCTRGRRSRASRDRGERGRPRPSPSGRSDRRRASPFQPPRYLPAPLRSSSPGGTAGDRPQELPAPPHVSLYAAP